MNRRNSGVQLLVSAAGLAALGVMGVLSGCAAKGVKSPAWTISHGRPEAVRSAQGSGAAQADHESAEAPAEAVAATGPEEETDAPLDLLATTNLSRVTFAEEGADFDPSVSRDGTHLVFASTQHRTTSDIYIKRTDSRVVTQLTSDPGQDAMAQISPEGSWIAFASDRAGNWDIYVMPVSGGKAVQITSDVSDEIQPSWSPDGKSLVFSRRGETSGRWEMWVADVKNPAVANFIGYGLFPKWCPAAGVGAGGSERILFQLGRERGRRTFSVWMLDYARGSASNSTEVATSSATALINPSWSPDGKWIVYAEVPAPAAGAEVLETKPAWATLWMVSVQGEGRVRLTGGPGVALSPTWAANNRLFFVGDRSGVDNIWSLDLSPAIAAAEATMGATRTTAAPAGSDGTMATVPESNPGPSADQR
jgi:TolB protein